MSECGSTRTCSSGDGEDTSATEVVIVDGFGKFRDGKRWKQRYCVLSKLSPAADCLQLQIYRDEKERARNGHTKASLSLQHFLAMESGFTLDKESHTLAIICQDLSVVLAFDNRERLIQWSVRITNNLGEGHQFLLQLASAPAKSKLTPGPVRLHVTDKKFCLTGGLPPRLLGAWEVTHLRRYGLVDGRLVFEGGSRCGKGEGVHVLVPDQPQITLIMDALDMSSKGQLLRMPSRRFGNVMDSPRKSLGNRFSEMRTVLPAESSANVSICTNMNITMSPTPRESRSAEELCSACTDGPSGSSNSIWMSSETSSRCDLDSCENLSVIATPACQTMSTSSPSKTHQYQSIQSVSSQIPKPLPSAMERCLSCMSKLGQGGLQLQTSVGKDILSPSWTMDLGGTNCGAAAAPHSHSSGNSDRLSISSHGSSGGVTEYYYDTPRSILKCDPRRNPRSNTPPVPRVDSGQPTCSAVVRGCESPQRVPMRNGCPATLGQGGHCNRQGAAMPCGGPGHIYYCIPEQPLKSSLAGGPGGAGNETKTSINLHSHPGPYENYDFPRQAVNPNPVSVGGNSESSTCCNGSCCTSNIDWAKKQAMDRSSVASSTMGHSEFSEWYDVPRQTCGCTNHSFQQAHPSNQHCTTCTGRPGPPMNGQYQNQKAQLNGCHQCPSAGGVRNPNPLENYDVPSNCALVVENPPHRPAILNGRVNGEGRMPLATTSANPIAIYAQVDKTKKKPKPLPHTCDISHQPTYMNVTADNRHPQPVQQPQAASATATPEIKKTGASYNPTNYVNLEFACSLPIYENSRDVRNQGAAATADVLLVQQNQRSGGDDCERKSTEKAVVYTKNEIILETKEIARDASSANETNQASASGIQSKSLDGDSGALPLRRSSSVPCKGGHANRGSASSSDSGVSGDGGLFFDDSSPLNDIGSLCLHESLPRKGQRSSPGSTSGKNTSIASTPKAQSSIETEDVEVESPVQIEGNHQHEIVSPENSVPGIQNRLSPRHYETIDEVERPKVSKTPEPTPVRPTLTLRNPRSLVSDANSTSSGASDMSDYIDTLSSCSRASLDMASNNSHPFAQSSTNNTNVVGMNISSSSSPKKSTNMKPRSGKEYFKIDRAMFARND